MKRITTVGKLPVLLAKLITDNDDWRTTILDAITCLQNEWTYITPIASLVINHLKTVLTLESKDLSKRVAIQQLERIQPSIPASYSGTKRYVCTSCQHRTATKCVHCHMRFDETWQRRMTSGAFVCSRCVLLGSK